MQTPADAFRRILEVLDRLKIGYLAGGSIASSVHGIPRTTMDVDLVVELRLDHVERFYTEVKSDFYADLDTMKEALELGCSFNLIHYDSAYKFDIFPLQPDDYSQTEFARRQFGRTSSVGEEPIHCAIATAEDTILSKLRWYSAGGESSERQWSDLRGVLQVSGGQLDLEYLRHWAARLGVADLLDRLLDESGHSPVGSPS